MAIRVGNESLPALWACALRLGFASILFAVILLVAKQPLPKGEALKAALWYGMLEFGISLPLLYWGEKAVSSGLAAVLYAICPVATMIGARLMGFEKLDPRRLGAAVFAFLGVAVIFWRQVLAGGSAVGLLCVFLAALCGSAAALMYQRGPKQSALAANAVGTFVGFVPALLVSFLAGEPHPLPTTFGSLFPIAYLAVASSIVAFGLFAWLIGHWNASTVSFLGVIVPVIAVFVGYLALHEALAPGSIVGAGVVLASVSVALLSDKQPRTTN